MSYEKVFAKATICCRTRVPVEILALNRAEYSFERSKQGPTRGLRQIQVEVGCHQIYEKPDQ